ncbi:MAG: hypothetical protein ACF8NJ_05700 [Phycisphaerales bacterium JB038]
MHMTHRRIWLSAGALVLAAGTTLAADGASLGAALGAAPQPAVGVLNLAGGDVDTARLANLLLHQPDRFADRDHYVLQLDGPITPARRAALSSIGVVLGDYLPTHAYTADLAAVRPADLAQVSFLLWAGVYDGAWKLAPDLETRLFSTPERQLLSDRGEAALVVTLFEGASAADALDALSQLSGVAAAESEALAGNPTLHLTAPLYQLDAIAALDAVQFIEHAPEVE